jgi:hypothetical protein
MLTGHCVRRCRTGAYPHIVRLLSSRLRIVPQGIRELPHQAHQFVDVVHLPCFEDGAPNPLAPGVDEVSHRLALGTDNSLTHAAVGSTVVSLHQSKAFELRDLTADRGVIAPDAIGQFHDTDRPEPLNSNKQRKQRPVERNAGLPDKHLVALWPVYGADDIEHRRVKLAKLVTNMCILHFLS